MTQNNSNNVETIYGHQDYEFIKKIDVKKKYLVLGFIKQIYRKDIPAIILSKCTLYYAYYNANNNVVLVVGKNKSGQFGTCDTNDVRRFKKLKWSFGLSITKIICNWEGCRFITASNDIYVTGHNRHGQLGLGNNTNQLKPQKHPFFANKLQILNASYCSTSYCSIFICCDGSIYGCGQNNFGELGLGNAIRCLEPHKVTFFNNVKIVSAAFTFSSSLFLTSNGDVYSCGRNLSFQLGYATSSDTQRTPKKIDDLKDIISIQCGLNHSYCLSKNGIVYCFGGANTYGELGVEKSVWDSNKLSIHKITWFIKNNKCIKAISAGKRHTAAIDSNGNAFVWGYGGAGAIGNGIAHRNDLNTADIFIPFLVNTLKDMEITNISCSSAHTIALTKKKSLYCWGSNRNYECSKHTQDIVLFPSEYYKNDYIDSVYAGEGATFILLNPV